MDSWEDKNQEEYQSRKKCLISWLLSKDAGCVVLKLAAPTLQTTIEAKGTIPHQCRAGISLKVRAFLYEISQITCSSTCSLLLLSAFVLTIFLECTFEHYSYPTCSKAFLYFQVVKDLHKAVCDSGMNVLCVVSKADVVDKAVAQDIRNIVFSRSFHLLRKCINSQTGIPMNQVCSRPLFCCSSRLIL